MFSALGPAIFIDVLPSGCKRRRPSMDDASCRVPIVCPDVCEIPDRVGYFLSQSFLKKDGSNRSSVWKITSAFLNTGVGLVSYISIKTHSREQLENNIYTQSGIHSQTSTHNQAYIPLWLHFCVRRLVNENLQAHCKANHALHDRLFSRNTHNRTLSPLA